MNTANAHVGGDAPRIEDRGPLSIAGLSIVCTETAGRDIPALWQRFASHIGKIPGQVGSTTYGVCREDAAGRVEYLCGVEVRDTESVPMEFNPWNLPAQRYAVFTHAGHVSTLRDTIDAIFSKRLRAAKLTPAKAPFFERYGSEFNASTGLGGMEIWVPVQG